MTERDTEGLAEGFHRGLWLRPLRLELGVYRGTGCKRRGLRHKFDNRTLCIVDSKFLRLLSIGLVEAVFIFNSTR